MSGIGNVTEQMLNSLNIFTCGDLWTYRGVINLLFKPATVSFLLAVSLGIGSSWFNVSDAVDQNQKSISSERTFSGSNTNVEPKLCHSLCTDLERELISKELKAHTVTLKIKTVDFQVKTRAVRLLSATNEADIIFETAWSIYKSYANDIKDLAIRLLGVRLSNFQPICDETDDSQINNLPLGKQKKQGRIDHLLLKLQTKEVTEKNIPKFECPICCAKFFVYNEVEVHVERCLSNSSVVSVTAETSSNSSSSSTISGSMAGQSLVGEHHPKQSDAPRNSNKNKRKSPQSNDSNGKKRQKINRSVKHRKITDYTTSERRTENLYTSNLQQR